MRNRRKNEEVRLGHPPTGGGGLRLQPLVPKMKTRCNYQLIFEMGSIYDDVTGTRRGSMSGSVSMSFILTFDV